MCIPIFNIATVTIIKMWKQPNQPLISKWIKEIQDTHKMEHYSFLKKKKEILQYVTIGIDLEKIMLR